MTKKQKIHEARAILIKAEHDIHRALDLCPKSKDWTIDRTRFCTAAFRVAQAIEGLSLQIRLLTKRKE